MANELNINLSSFTFLKNGIAINITPLPNPLSVTVTGLHSIHDQMAIPSVGLTLNKGNISTIGYAYFRNLDAAISINIGDGTTNPIFLHAGEFALIRWNAANVNAQSASGTPLLEYMLIED